MKTILVPCDFSKLSNEAFQVAIELASNNKGVIMLLHAIAVPNLYTTGFSGEPLAFNPVYFTKMEEDAKKALEKMRAKATSHSIKANTEVVYGELTSAIKKAIEVQKIDLIIMGTSGASGLAEIFVGSNTEKVVRFSPVPVLAVRKFIDIKSVKNILLPSTLDLNQTDFMNKVKALQESFGATLHVLLINTPVHFRRDAEAYEALEEFARHYQLKNYETHFRNYGHEDDGIIDFAIAEKADLIVMATNARKGLSHLFNGSITEDVVNHAQTPVWTYCLKH